jgi:hypothetical protein
MNWRGSRVRNTAAVTCALAGGAVFMFAAPNAQAESGGVYCYMNSAEQGNEYRLHVTRTEAGPVAVYDVERWVGDRYEIETSIREGFGGGVTLPGVWLPPNAACGDIQGGAYPIAVSD